VLFLLQVLPNSSLFSVAGSVLTYRHKNLIIFLTYDLHNIITKYNGIPESVFMDMECIL